MVYGLWHSAAGLQAQLYKQVVVANNRANVDTPGFKPDRVAFSERLNASIAGGPVGMRDPIMDGQTGGLFETPVYTQYTQGSLVPSGNKLDVAINGDGFIPVRTAEGVRYTRDGRLTMGLDGSLRQAGSGAAVVDADGTVLRVDPRSKDEVRITPSGEVRQGESVVGRIALMDFADKRHLEKVGENLYAADPKAAVKADGELQQGFYEGSGVDPTSNLVEMMAATRAYEMNASMLSLQDETLQRVVNDVGRVTR